MTETDLATTTAATIGRIGAAFYFDAATVARGKELGLDGFRFYFLGRGGVLGNCEASVVASAFGYFNPSVVESMWNSGRERLDPRTAAREYLSCAQAFAEERFASVEGLSQFALAAEKVVAAVDRAGLALFAGIAAEPLPETAPARAYQLTAVLREFRGSAHLLAVVACELEPRLAHALRRPDSYALFGWTDSLPLGTDADRAKLAAADALTDRLVGAAFSVLGPEEAGHLRSGLAGMDEALASPAPIAGTA
jgi:hypothetical protein